MNIDEDIKNFADDCIFARAIYVHSKTLFESSSAEQKEIMSRTAPKFFQDLNIVFIEYVILQVCKIIDPAKFGKNENLTIEFLLGNYDSTAKPQKAQTLHDLNEKMKRFGSKLSEARNKRIAHSDRAASLDGYPLGGVPNTEWDDFWLNLSKFISIVHGEVDETPMDIRNIWLSDADSLLKALKQSACFEHLLNGNDATLTQKCANLMWGGQVVGCHEPATKRLSLSAFDR